MVGPEPLLVSPHSDSWPELGSTAGHNTGGVAVGLEFIRFFFFLRCVFAYGREDVVIEPVRPVKGELALFTQCSSCFSS